MKAEAFASAHTISDMQQRQQQIFAAMKAEAFASAHPWAGQWHPWNAK